MQTSKPSSIFKLGVGFMTIFGVIGFTASVINAFYGGGINFEIIWLSIVSMITIPVILGMIRHAMLQTEGFHDKL